MMKQFCSCCLAVLVMVLGSRAGAAAASSDRPPLRLVQTIRMTNIGGGEPDVPPEQLAKEAQTTRMTNLQEHFDHFEVDLKRQRLFVTPEDNKSVEVYDLRSGESDHSIRGIGMAHTVLYRPDLDELFVTDGTEGSLKIFSGKDYRFTKTVKLLTDADSMGYDPDSHYLYIDNGGTDAERNYCLLSIVDTNSGQEVGEIKIDSNRVEAMVLEKSGPRLFRNATEKNEVAVIDREKRAVVATWPVTGGRVNVAITIG